MPSNGGGQEAAEEPDTSLATGEPSRRPVFFERFRVPLGIGLLCAGWFLYFSRDVLGVHFAPDDMMNVDNFYWTPGLWRLFYSQFLIWRGYYRPMGGLFYLPILSVWGLDPVPYHVALSLIL